MSSKNKKISIIGAGASGISCALILTKFGYDVTIYTKDKPFSKSVSSLFVSRYPAASIIPHSVTHPNVKTLFKSSFSYFKKLFNSDFPGLKVHKHYELFSNRKEIPFYHDQMYKFHLIERFDQIGIPKHPEITLLSGWEFECFFADWNIYFQALINEFEQLGGVIIEKEIDHKEITSIESDIVINCAEINGPKIAGENFNPVLYRGHLIHIKDAPYITDNNGMPISYNLTPPLNLYKSENGNPQDLYLYPRQDGWILGGSRQIGTLSNDGKWIGEEVIERSQDLNGTSFPKQILALQQPIIKETFGFDLDSFPKITLNVGYRFMGNNNEGLRLESEEKFGKLLIHNYGHGGSGVALSWGCALEVASLVNKKTISRGLELENVSSFFN